MRLPWRPERSEKTRSTVRDTQGNDVTGMCLWKYMRSVGTQTKKKHQEVVRLSVMLVGRLVTNNKLEH